LLGLAAVSAAIPAQAFETWISLRDAGVVRQSQDFSCGIAALATILTHYYGDAVSEAALLAEFLEARTADDTAVVEDMGVSFADLEQLARMRGFPTLGISLDHRDLKKLSQPVIVALNTGGRAHFSVLRRVESGTTFLLADPSWGNRRLGESEFLGLFASGPAGQRGRVLIVGSGFGEAKSGEDFRLPEQRIRMLPASFRVPP
jgi:predicted double-glycine peptidase